MRQAVVVVDDRSIDSRSLLATVEEAGFEGLLLDGTGEHPADAAVRVGAGIVLIHKNVHRGKHAGGVGVSLAFETTDKHPDLLVLVYSGDRRAAFCPALLGAGLGDWVVYTAHLEARMASVLPKLAEFLAARSFMAEVVAPARILDPEVCVPDDFVLDRFEEAFETSIIEAAHAEAGGPGGAAALLGDAERSLRERTDKLTIRAPTGTFFDVSKWETEVRAQLVALLVSDRMDDIETLEQTGLRIVRPQTMRSVARQACDLGVSAAFVDLGYRYGAGAAVALMLNRVLPGLPVALFVENARSPFSAAFVALDVRSPVLRRGGIRLLIHRIVAAFRRLALAHAAMSEEIDACRFFLGEPHPTERPRFPSARKPRTRKALVRHACREIEQAARKQCGGSRRKAAELLKVPEARLRYREHGRSPASNGR